MRARNYKAAHRNLADSKRSIVMMCAGLALVLGTTSAGSTMLSNGDPLLIERTATPLSTGNIGSNEVTIDEPATQLLQGETTVVPRKTSLPASDQPLSIGASITTSLLNQLQNQQSGGQAAQDPATHDPSTGDSSAGGDTDPDPNHTTGGNDGGTVEEDPVIVDEDTDQEPAAPSNNQNVQQSASETPPLQGSGSS